MTIFFAAWLLAYPAELKRMAFGAIVPINGKVYGVCQKCRWVVRVDKPFVGSLHVCEPQGEP